MAYAFDSLVDSLDEEPKKQDIFGTPQPASDQGVGQQTSSSPSDATGGVQKTSTAGDLSAPPASNQGGGETQRSSATQKTSQAINAAGQRQKAPSQLTDLSTGLSQAKTGLENEANAMVASAQAKDYRPSNDTLEAAVKGDQSAYGSIRNVLMPQKTQAPEYKSAVNTSLTNPDEIGTDLGVLKLMQGGKFTPEYTPGMKAFDLAVINKSPEIQAAKKSVIDQQKALTGEAQNYADTLPGQLSAIDQSRQDEAKAYARQYLGGQADAARGQAYTAAKAAADAELARRQGILGAAPQTVRDTLQKELAGDPRNLKFLPGASVDPGAYFQGPGEVSPEGFLPQDQVSRFNSIEALLGNADQLQPGLNPAAGFDADYGASAGKYKQALADATLAARRGDDERLSKLVGGINSAATTRYNDAAAAALEKGSANVLSRLGDANHLPGNFVDYLGELGINVDPKQYLKGAGGAQQYLTGDEFTQIQQALGELPSLGNASAYKAQDVTPSSFFDDKAYETALVQAYNAAASKNFAGNQARDSMLKQQATYHPGTRAGSYVATSPLEKLITGYDI